MTYHQSTFNIREDLIPRLEGAAETLNMKRSRVVEALLVKFMDNTKGGEKSLEQLKYQIIKKGVKSKKMGIFWRRDVYERSLDVRKVFKISVSYAIAVSIERYLDELIKEIQHIESKGGAYNYNTFYFINADYHSNSFVYTTIWNNPGDEILWKVTNL